MALEDSRPGELDSAVPLRPQSRDAVGRACFIVHFLPLLYALTGWLAPDHTWLIVYLIFIPALFLQWKLNKGACVLNNIESLIRSGRWRNPANREEGAWLRTLMNERTGWNLSRAQMDMVINAVMLALWLLAFARLMR
ncbi:MAG: hypothetical protein ACJ8IR_11665 [Alphaproteobacteria bacterium]